MGNCKNCKFCNEQDNDSINTSLKISSDTILGDYSKHTPSNSLCCCKVKPIKNQVSLDNIILSPKEKKIFEKRISRNLSSKKNIIK